MRLVSYELSMVNEDSNPPKEYQKSYGPIKLYPESYFKKQSEACLYSACAE